MLSARPLGPELSRVGSPGSPGQLRLLPCAGPSQLGGASWAVRAGRCSDQLIRETRQLPPGPGPRTRHGTNNSQLCLCGPRIHTSTQQQYIQKYNK